VGGFSIVYGIPRSGMECCAGRLWLWLYVASAVKYNDNIEDVPEL
jgi:hypothetical protein